MKISLIGMSGCGKTYWSKKLVTEGFKLYCCDDLIEKKLGKELKELGYSGIHDMSKWLGQPYDKRHKENSDRYLSFEDQVLREIISEVKNTGDENIVVDTTGSFIYHDQSILQQLMKMTTVVYIATPADVQKEMYQSYLEDPKPVVWSDSYHKKDGESDMDALKRCYPGLLSTRTKKYEKLADITLHYYRVRKDLFTAKELIELVEIQEKSLL